MFRKRCCDTISPMRKLALTLTALAMSSSAFAAKTLDFYFIDVEGGQATLIVSPSKQAMLVDAGWPGFSGRDASRIAAAAKAAGVKQLDYLITTHFHTDHAGGVPQIAEKLPVKTFIDHGASVETNKGAKELYEAYEKVAGQKRRNVKPGESIEMKGLEITVLTANGDHIMTSAKGGGAANPLCGASFPEDAGENARSVGFLLQFGKFRFLDLGDLTSQKEMELVCPENRVGTVDVYLTTHHGLPASNAKGIVQAIQPRVAIMNNGARKGGAPEAWQTIHTSPGMEDMWQVHFSIAGGKENNVAEPMIANLVENCEGQYLKLSANADGSFTVYNSRNKYTKTYAAKH